MADPQHQRDYDAYRRVSRGRVFAFFVEGRFLVIPGPFLVASIFFFLEPELWRRVVLLSVLPLALAITVWERAKYRAARARSDSDWLTAPPINMGAMLVLAATVFVATGGVASPIAFVFPISMFVVSILGERRTARIGLVADVVVIWVAAIVEETPSLSVLVPAHFRTVSPWQTWLTAVTLTFATLIAHTIGRRIADVFDEMLREVTDGRDEARRMHAEQTRALTQLSGEIAHELKNPLASVKGLAALVAKDATGKGAEHLTVLRREVDRMQAILDEFLNFSRPLVPLALADVDLARLAEDVAELHAGAERERGVRVEAAPSGAPHVRADERKLKQVLINLVQNAIDASPKGGVVRVVARDETDFVGVEVRDEGHGLDADVAARVFDPGVTSKPQGSGLGLTIARALARQHGGDVELASSDAGCTATLRIPKQAAGDREAA